MKTCQKPLSGKMLPAGGNRSDQRADIDAWGLRETTDNASTSAVRAGPTDAEIQYSLTQRAPLSR